MAIYSNLGRSNEIFLHFKREEYARYPDFLRVDKDLDLETTVTVDRGIAVLLKFFISESENSVYWYDKKGMKITTRISRGWTPNIRALISHLALDVWYPSVKDLVDSGFNIYNENYLKAIRWTASRRSVSGSRVHIVMPLYAGGIFDYPTKYTSLFSRSFIMNYCLAKLFAERFDYAFLKEIIRSGEAVVSEQITQFKALMGIL